jgi:hypothetical protein
LRAAQTATEAEESPKDTKINPGEVFLKSGNPQASHALTRHDTNVLDWALLQAMAASTLALFATYYAVTGLKVGARPLYLSSAKAAKVASSVESNSRISEVVVAMCFAHLFVFLQWKIDTTFVTNMIQMQKTISFVKPNIAECVLAGALYWLQSVCGIVLLIFIPSKYVPFLVPVVAIIIEMVKVHQAKMSGALERQNDSEVDKLLPSLTKDGFQFSGEISSSPLLRKPAATTLRSSAFLFLFSLHALSSCLHTYPFPYSFPYTGSSIGSGGANSNVDSELLTVLMPILAVWVIVLPTYTR